MFCVGDKLLYSRDNSVIIEIIEISGCDLKFIYLCGGHLKEKNPFVFDDSVLNIIKNFKVVDNILIFNNNSKN